MKLWLLDADVIIKLLELGVFGRLAHQHEVHVATTVISEVKYYRDNGAKVSLDFRATYVTPGLVREDSATADELQEIVAKLPPLKQETIHDGELESLAVLAHQEDLTLCTFDAAAIRALPFIDATERSISAERLLETSGLKLSPGHKLDVRLTEEYFKDNLGRGVTDFIQSLESAKLASKGRKK